MAKPIIRKVIIVNKIGERLLVPMHWGLVRPDGGIAPTYARAESIADKPMFRDLLLEGRCLVPMRGYYEHPKGSRKKTYFVSDAGREFVGVAGLYSAFANADGTMTASYCMITTEPAPAVSHLSDRMLAILQSKDEEDLWLDREEQDLQRILALLRPFDGELTVSEGERAAKEGRDGGTNSRTSQGTSPATNLSLPLEA